MFEYLPYDLKKYITRQEEAGSFTPAAKKRIFYQNVKAVAFLHSKRVLHRDLKPQNVLVDASGNIKVADFGLARQYSIPIKKYTHEVVTVWYRAPEILLGSSEYTTSVDTWSLGCILAELYNNEPLFPGDSEIGEIFKIFQALGTPTEDIWKGVTKLHDFKDVFPKWKPQPMKSLCPRLDEDGLDLLQKMLTYDPVARISPKDALKHPFFKDVMC